MYLGLALLTWNLALQLQNTSPFLGSDFPGSPPVSLGASIRITFLDWSALTETHSIAIVKESNSEVEEFKEKVSEKNSFAYNKRSRPSSPNLTYYPIAPAQKYDLPSPHSNTGYNSQIEGLFLTSWLVRSSWLVTL